jgi:monooxygenase
MCAMDRTSPQASTLPTEHQDVLIVGAGLSGIGAAVHLKTHCPGQSFSILEARAAIGGTWDLFRYPGVRSDSDMYTLGYRFKAWTQAKAIADGPSILAYLQEAVQENALQKHIRCNTRVQSANWSNADALWTVQLQNTEDGSQRILTTKFLWICSGYYRYDQGYTPDFPNIASFAGRVIHPQHWPNDLDYAGKRVVIIGSGATAITLVPSMAAKAAHVTMLQRSPSYVVSLPAEDRLANWMNRWLPRRLAYAVTRWKNVLFGMAFYNGAKRFPDFFKRLIVGGAQKALGPGVDVEKHFTPSYNPWDQRVCLVPDSDLFRAIKGGRASVVTDHIDTFTPTGIKLRSGAEIAADVVVTATGLDWLAMGGMELSVEGKPVAMDQSITYKGMMLADVPNMAFVVGYTNASWTLKADLVSEYVCRTLNHMRKTGMRQCTPRMTDSSVQRVPAVDFTSGYIQRALDRIPAQGDKAPWRLDQNYIKDVVTLRFGRLEDGAMEFSNPPPQ